MLNKVILMGRLTSDPELKTTTSGISVAQVTIACERSYAKKGEEKKTDFINVVAWRNNAEFLCKYFKKGSLVLVEGTIQTRSYEAKDGTKRYVTEVMSEGFSFTGERRDSAEKQKETSTQPAANIPPEQEFVEMPVDDDLPF